MHRPYGGAGRWAREFQGQITAHLCAAHAFQSVLDSRFFSIDISPCARFLFIIVSSFPVTLIPLSDFPAIDATLNGTSALLLRLGYFFIRRKKTFQPAAS